MQLPLIVITGPTAVGKTDLSVKLALNLGAEIISADSRQVYWGMDIGTAKPSVETRRLVPHHLIDVVKPDEEFTVADFKALAEVKIDQLHFGLRIADFGFSGDGHRFGHSSTEETWFLNGHNGQDDDQGRFSIPQSAIRNPQSVRIPLLVGGTFLYIRSIVDGLFPGPSASPEVRRELTKEAERLGPDHLFEKLKEIDPIAAAKLNPGDLRRVTRAIEVYYLTGQPISYLQAQKTTRKNYSVLMIALLREREELFTRIRERIEQMVQTGLVDEVQQLLDQGFDPGLRSMEGLGYREIVGYLKGEYDLSEARAIILKRTKRLARYQLGWIRKDNRYHLFHPDQEDEILAQIERFLTDVPEGSLGKCMK
ncbi:MAG: tRNA (adenosine(37)-N6)-dimethylallyltransferase MiaA [bacterium]|nr:tRNA (adenosine(37)-N6)-dimethylallyltransferase MiaA [bacterium]